LDVLQWKLRLLALLTVLVLVALALAGGELNQLLSYMDW
jgi:hypothetical protein